MTAVFLMTAMDESCRNAPQRAHGERHCGGHIQQHIIWSLKRKEILLFIPTETDLEDTIISTINQSQKDNSADSPYPKYPKLALKQKIQWQLPWMGKVEIAAVPEIVVWLS